MKIQNGVVCFFAALGAILAPSGISWILAGVLSGALALAVFRLNAICQKEIAARPLPILGKSGLAWVGLLFVLGMAMLIVSEHSWRLYFTMLWMLTVICFWFNFYFKEA